jgi:hypothetical protein
LTAGKGSEEVASQPQLAPEAEGDRGPAAKGGDDEFGNPAAASEGGE